MAIYTAREVREKGIKLKKGDSIRMVEPGDEEPATLPTFLHFAGKNTFLGHTLNEIMKTYYTILIWKESDEYREGKFR